MPANDQNLPKKFYGLFSEEEWDLLQQSAKRDGKKDIRRFLTAEMFRLEKKMRDLQVDCAKKPKRIKNTYQIPEELQEFYGKLACHYGRTVSEIITRLIIMPNIIEMAKINKEEEERKTA